MRSNSGRMVAMRRLGQAMNVLALLRMWPRACPPRGQSESTATVAPNQPPNGKWELKQGPRCNSTGLRWCRDATQGEGKGVGETQTIARRCGHVTRCQGGRNYFPVRVLRNHCCNPDPPSA